MDQWSSYEDKDATVYEYTDYSNAVEKYTDYKYHLFEAMAPGLAGFLESFSMCLVGDQKWIERLVGHCIYFVP